MEKKEQDERGRVAAKKKKKNSRKDIASYASDERGVTLEISERQNVNGMRKKVSMVRRKGGGGEYSREEKSNPLQCISGAG